MADPNLRDFYGRVYRIRRAHRRGGGFEAVGALGRAYFVPRPGRAWPVGKLLRPVFFIFVVVTIMKSLILAQIGMTTYDDHIATLMQGDAFDRVGAYLMMADPLSRGIAAILQLTHY